MGGFQKSKAIVITDGMRTVGKILSKTNYLFGETKFESV